MSLVTESSVINRNTVEPRFNEVPRDWGNWFVIQQWNLDLTKCQGTGEIGSLYRGFVISRFFSIHYTISGLKNVVRYTEDFAI